MEEVWLHASVISRDFLRQAKSALALTSLRGSQINAHCVNFDGYRISEYKLEHLSCFLSSQRHAQCKIRANNPPNGKRLISSPQPVNQFTCSNITQNYPPDRPQHPPTPQNSGNAAPDARHRRTQQAHPLSPAARASRRSRSSRP